MNFKEIEKRVPEYVRHYIKDGCYESVFDRVEIKEKEKTGTGTVYTSTYIYKKVLDEKKYKELVRKTYINDYQSHYEQQETKTKKRAKESGKNTTIKEFLQDLFRDHFEFRKGEFDNKGRRIYLKSFLFNIDAIERVIDEKKVVRNLEKLYQKIRHYGYFTPNMFISHQYFTKEMLSLMGVIILDFDLDKVHKVMSKEQLKKYIKKKLGVVPNYIWDTKTKGNYQAAIMIEKMPATPKSVHLYEQIVKEMIIKLGDVVDESCYNANHIFSLPMNNKRKNKLTRKYSNEIRNINEFRWLLDERDKRREKERKIIDFKEENFMREPAIQALINGDVSWRDHACFTLALVLRWLGKEEFEAENFILGDWLGKVNNENYDHPFTIREAQKCVRHAYSGKYKCFHSKWVETVTGIDCNFSGYFKWKNYENKGIYITDTEKRIIEYLKENGGQVTMKQSELVEELGVKARTLRDNLKKLRERGEVHYPTVRGAGKVTTFTYVEDKTDQFERMLEFAFGGIDDDLTAIHELEQEVENLRA